MAITLVGAKEIGKILGVSRQRVHELRRTHDDFPEPVATLASGAVWDRDQVVKWAKAWDRHPGAWARRKR